jgi:hypothetical protein
MLKSICTVYKLTRQKLVQITWLIVLRPGVPLTFLLGFYVSLVVKRWWEQYCKAAHQLT